VDKGGGVCKMSTLVQSRGGGGQNLVHVVVECPLRGNKNNKIKFSIASLLTID
jgi:hypothetical protein